MAKAENRIVISLACSECKERNYHTTKNRRTRRTGWNLTSSVRGAAHTRCTAKPSNVILDADGAVYAALPHRGIAQLVEQRSPKPQVAGSIPAAPAKLNVGSWKMEVARTGCLRFLFLGEGTLPCYHSGDANGVCQVDYPRWCSGIIYVEPCGLHRIDSRETRCNTHRCCCI